MYLEKVEKAVLEIAKNIQKNTKGAVRDYEPSIKFRKFGTSNIEFTVVLGVKNVSDKFSVRHEFIKALVNRFRKENIEISYPVRKIINK